MNKKTLFTIHNAVSAIFIMENTDKKEFHKAIDDLIFIIKDSSIIEAKVFANWVHNLLLHHDDILTNEDYNKIKKPEEVLPMLAAGLKRYGDQLKKEGLQQGLEQGKLTEKKEIALNLYKEGTELEFISKITGFTIKELQDIFIKN